MQEHDWDTTPASLPGLLSRAPVDGLARAARFHGVSGCVYRSLASLPDAPSSVLNELQLGQHQALRVHLRTLADLAVIQPVLDGLGLPWAVVKGPVLAQVLYDHVDLRSYADLDLVVPARNLAMVLIALEEAGGTTMDRNWELLHRELLGEVHVRLPFGTLADVHWHLVNDRRQREALDIPMDEVLERRRTVELDDLVVPTLDPMDTLIHLGVHGCKSGGDRLVWLKDVERAVAGDGLDWDETVRRARRWRAGIALAVMLRRARYVLAAAVPDGVVEALVASTAWCGVLAATDRLSPVPAAGEKRSLARMVARSTRATAGTSARELGRHVAGAVIAAPSLRRQPGEIDVDPASPGSVLFSSGGAAGRAAYLEAVKDAGAGPES